MKKIIALLLAFCLTLGIFAGCGTTNETADTTTAKVETTGPVQTEPQAEDTACCKAHWSRINCLKWGIKHRWW